MTDEAIVALVEVRCTVPQTWHVHCPAHQDRSPSLSVGAGSDGRGLQAIVCRPGAKLLCTPEADGAEWPRLFHNALETYREAEVDACEWLRRICPNWRTR